jgi:hypothetical protein
MIGHSVTLPTRLQRALNYLGDGSEVNETVMTATTTTTAVAKATTTKVGTTTTKSALATTVNAVSVTATATATSDAPPKGCVDDDADGKDDDADVDGVSEVANGLVAAMAPALRLSENDHGHLHSTFSIVVLLVTRMIVIPLIQFACVYAFADE